MEAQHAGRALTRFARYVWIVLLALLLAAYIRALQLSQNATLDDVPTENRFSVGP